MDAVTPQTTLHLPAGETPLGHGRWAGLLWAMATLCIGLAITLSAWQQSRNTEAARASLQFEFAADGVVNEVTERLDTYVQAMWGVAGAISVNPDITRQEWRTLFEALHLIDRLPGAQAVGFARPFTAAERAAHVEAVRKEGYPDYAIWPPGERPSSVVVVMVQPEIERTRGVLGYDAAAEPERRRALERARDTGRPVVSGKVTLALHAASTAEPGFLLYLPVFRAKMPIATAEERRAALVGYVYSAFRASIFISSRGLTQRLQEAGVALEVYDGAGVRPANLLYRSPDFPSAATLAIAPSRAETIAEIVGGRTWTFRIASLRPPVGSNQSVSFVILIAGLLASLAAAAAVGTLALNRAQAMKANQRLREDVARRQQIEEKLRQSEAKFRQLFDNIPLPTFAIDRERSRYIAVNAAAIERYGYSHEDFAAMRIGDGSPSQDAHSMVSYLASLRGKVSHSGEFRHRKRDGTVVDVEIMAHDVELDGRRLTIVIAHDITERKAAERALAASEQKLRQAQKLEAVGQLTGGIAHDFNNILTVITGTVGILADGVAHDPKLAAITGLIDEAATRGADLTRDLLAFARRQPLQPRDTDVNDLVTGVSKLFRSTLGEHINVELRLDSGLWPAFVDPSQLTTALLNLALNSRDAMPNGGRLVIETANVGLDSVQRSTARNARAGVYVMIAVSDNGSGIPADIREKVFEPFFTTKEVGKGTGLGLSMVYGFVNQSNGHIEIYSEPGQGTTVRLYLPRASDTPASAKPPAESVRMEGGHETILVVEDDALVRVFVTEQLRTLGYAPLVAANAAEAQAIARRGTAFDLLFTDIVMPGPMNGRQLAEDLRRLRPGLRVLFTSGYSQEAAAGADFGTSVSILHKPYRKADLARRLRHALDTPARPPAEQTASREPIT